MFINSQTIGDVRQKIGTGGRFSTRFQRLVDELDTNWATLHSGSAIHQNAHALAYVAATIDSASSANGSSGVPGINYGSRTKTDYSTRAHACMDAWIANVSTVFPSDQGLQMALALDWSWPAMSTAQRRAYSSWVQTVDSYTALVAFPGEIVTSQANQAKGSQIMGAIALYGNGYADDWASSKVSGFADRWRSSQGISHIESFVSGLEMGGDSLEGPGYGWDYLTRDLPIVEEAVRTATGGSKSTHYGSTGVTVLRQLPTRMAAMLLPLEEASGSLPGGHRFTMFQGYRSAVRFPVASNVLQRSVGAVIGLYNGIDSTTVGLGQWLVENRCGEPGSDGIVSAAQCTPLYTAMGSSVAPTAVSPATLGLPLAFRYGETRAVIKTSWTDTNAAFFTVDTQKWGKGSISPRQSGAIAIHRKGPVITRAGTESGNVEFSNNLTGAASQMVFPDRTKSAKQNARDSMGGTRQLDSAPLIQGSSAFVNGGTFDLLSEYRQQFASSAAPLHYIGQNLERSYDSTATSDTTYNPTRVSNYWRHVVVTEPASTSETLRVFVYDRTITTSTAYVQTDCLRVVNAPTVTAASTTAGPSRVPTPTNSSNYADTPYFSTGGTFGHTTYSSARLLVVSSTSAGTNNKAFITPLLPAANAVVVVGGPSSNGSSWSQDSTVGFSLEGTDLYGVRYTPTPITSDWAGLHSGSYRVEITNADPASADQFLKTIEVGDSTITGSSVVFMNGGSFIGASLGTNAAFFNSTGETCSTGSLIVPSSGTFTAVITGFTPSASYTATRGSNISDVTNLDTGSTSLSWTASTAGTMRVRIAVPTAGGGANGTVGWS
jgi:hypothetical protein